MILLSIRHFPASPAAKMGLLRPVILTEVNFSLGGFGKVPKAAWQRRFRVLPSPVRKPLACRH
jgi:hypothetical protein